MGIVIPPRKDPNTGQTIYTTEDRYNDLMSQYNANQGFLASQNQGIPGLTAPVGTNGQIPGMNAPGTGAGIPGVGMAPPPRFQPPQQMSPPYQQAPMAGPYGRQALGLAGLLSANNPPGGGYPNGLLGGKRPFIPGGK